jgi:hypothetical protein
MSKASLAQAREILDLLSGSTSSEVQRLIEAGDLLGLVMKYGARGVDRVAFERLLKASHASGSFTPTNEIVQAVLARSRQRSWHLTQQTLHAMTSANFGVPRTSTAEALITPDIWLGSIRKTVTELWQWFLDVHHTSIIDCDWTISFATRSLRVVDPNRYGDTPGVRWVAIDTTAGLGAALPTQGRHLFAGLQLLTAAVVHPNWFKQLIQANGLWLGGLEARDGENAASPWTQAPLLTMHLGTIVFFAEEIKIASDRFLAPTFRDL